MNIEEYKKIIKENEYNAIQYDFKNNIDECLISKNIYIDQIYKIVNNIKNENDNILKFAEYKFNKKLKSEDKNVIKDLNFDCDSTELAMKIYVEVYDFLKNGIVKFQWYPKKDIKDEEKRKGFTNKIIKEIKIEKQNISLEYVGDTMNSFQTIANCITGKTNKNSIQELRNFEKNINIKEKIYEFARLTHTIGNFIPVPKGSFNGARYNPTNDFWDLTLMCIKDYYIEPSKHTPLCSILFCNKNNTTWLNQFGYGEDGWKNFINKNFLNMYVDNYEVIPLFKDHSFEKKLPKDDEIEEFLENVCSKIQKRGEIICKNLVKE